MARKSVNEELNLTPFIGLFAMLVVLLLVTAVWNQVYVFSTKVDAPSANATPNKDKKQVQLSVDIRDNYIEFTESRQPSEKYSHKNGKVNRQRLTYKLKLWRQKYPKKTDVILNTDDRVPYAQLIAVFDTLVESGWPDVGVNTQ